MTPENRPGLPNESIGDGSRQTRPPGDRTPAEAAISPAIPNDIADVHVPAALLQRMTDALESLTSSAQRPSDWLTEAEAASYCRVSLTTFRAGYEQLGVVARRAFGRKLYAREELRSAISNSPAWNPLLETAHNGRPRVMANPLLANLRPERLRPYKPRKKTTET